MTALDHYRTLPTSKLRRYQDVVNAQIRLAYGRRNTAALTRLQERADALIMALIERTEEVKS